MATYAIKGDEKILVNEQNKNFLEGYKFVQEELSEIDKIEKEFQETIKIFTGGYSQAEIDTWNTKVEEAKKVLAGGTSDLLNALLLEGETVEDFATNVLAKAQEYSKIYLAAEKKKREKLSLL